MADSEGLARRVGVIEERNRRVEVDKAWETSLARRGVLAILTYAIVLSFFIMAELADPFISSTWSLPAIKRAWIGKRRYAYPPNMVTFGNIVTKS